MKHLITIIAALILSATSASAQEAYALMSTDSTTLTFYYDTQKANREGTAFEMNVGDSIPHWLFQEYFGQKYTKVIFDPSFKNYRPTTCAYWFGEFRDLTNIEGMKENLNTSEVTNMSYMFAGCNNLPEIDLSGFNTENVVDMHKMFAGCNEITTLDFSTFNTAKVTTMGNMFQGCINLTELDLSTFNTDNVTSMHSMFILCKQLKKLNISTFNTSNVESMAYMFGDCQSLETLDVSKFNTAKVVSMFKMFAGCKYLLELDVSNFNTEQVTTMQDMFMWCHNLQNIDVSGFNTTNVTNMSGMFADCTELSSIDVSGFNTDKVTDMSCMFSKCYKLTNLNLSGFKTDKVKSMRWMFTDCHSLASIDLSSFYTFNVESIEGIFENCKKLKKIYIGDYWKFRKDVRSDDMFQGCNLLSGGKKTKYDESHTDKEYARIDGGKSAPGYFTYKNNVISYPPSPREAYYVFNNDTMVFFYNNDRPIKSYNLNNNRLVDYNHKITTVVFDPSFKDYRPTSCANWFTYCTYLTTFIGITEYLNTDSVTDMNSMFKFCEKLKTLDLSGFNTENVENMNSMFYSCSNLETIYVGDKWIMNKNNRSQNMFQYCYQLCGENGTDYSPQKYNDYFYAKIDGEGTLKQGYFTAKGHTALRPYSVIENGVQTFRFDGQKPENAYNMRKSKPEWNVNDIYKIVFDTSFYKYKPQSLESWFEGYSNLTEIEGTEYLNTSKATTMVNMFKGCKNITVLDLSGFNTSGLTFGFCFKDKSEVQAALDDPNFSWPNSSPCFKGTFSGCSKLQTIYVGDYWKSSYFFSNTVKINDSTSTFYKCEQLIGGAGTKYKNGCDLFQIDEGESSPGYLTYKSPFDYTDSQGNTPYAVLKDSTLYLYFNNDKPSNAIGIRAWDDNVCKLVTKIVLDKSFKNYKLKSCRGLFAFLYNVKTIEGINENLNTENVFDFANMFNNCYNLTDLDLSGLNTAKATDMSGMFEECHKLSSIDISGFNTTNLEKIVDMFYNCHNLKTIYSDNLWNVDHLDSTYSIFQGCEMLFGEKGSECNIGKELVSFAHIDGGDSNPGYFTLKGNNPYEPTIDYYKALQPYLVLFNGILTFYYDQNRPVQSLGWPKWERTWLSFTDSTIVKVVFDKSFANYRPTSTELWFSDCSNLNSIEGMEYLNTSEVINMRYMFANCSKLTNIDLNHFNTQKVYDMSYMFANCTKLTNIDLSHFNTQNVTHMLYMFANCTKLSKVDLSHFNTQKVTQMDGMFALCENITELDLSSFNTSEVMSMYNMFHECKKLKTIFVSNKWVDNLIRGEHPLFTNCPKLIGGKGTKFTPEKTDKEYARIDGGISAPGYFTEKK